MKRRLARELEIFLSNNNYVCEVCYDGTLRIGKSVAVNLYDFILIDLGLPDYEGLDLLKEAKKSNPEAAYIILTARAEIYDRIKGFGYGCR